MLTVITPADSRDLTCLSAIKAELGLTVNDDDAYLAAAITQASGEIEDWTGRVFAVETVAETIQTPRPRHDLALSRFPVQAIASVIVNGAAIDPGRFRADPEAGLLSSLDSLWQGNIVITYTAGFAVPPPLVERATIALVVMRWHGRGRDPALKSFSLPDIAAESYALPASNDGLPEAVTACLSRYRVECFA